MASALSFNGFIPVFTIGFRGLSSDTQAEIMYKSSKQISDKTDMIIFKPAPKEGLIPMPYLEDEERTLIINLKGLDQKVYAKLDDFGSPEALKENMGEKNYPQNSKVQRVLTFMLAEEY